MGLDRYDELGDLSAPENNGGGLPKGFALEQKEELLYCSAFTGTLAPKMFKTVALVALPFGLFVGFLAYTQSHAPSSFLGTLLLALVFSLFFGGGNGLAYRYRKNIILTNCRLVEFTECEFSGRGGSTKHDEVIEFKLENLQSVQLKNSKLVVTMKPGFKFTTQIPPNVIPSAAPFASSLGARGASGQWYCTNKFKSAPEIFRRLPANLKQISQNDKDRIKALRSE